VTAAAKFVVKKGTTRQVQVQPALTNSKVIATQRGARGLAGIEAVRKHAAKAVVDDHSRENAGVEALSV
jgi:hypothetical protein